MSTHITIDRDIFARYIGWVMGTADILRTLVDRHRDPLDLATALERQAKQLLEDSQHVLDTHQDIEKP